MKHNTKCSNYYNDFDLFATTTTIIKRTKTNEKMYVNFKVNKYN